MAIQELPPQLADLLLSGAYSADGGVLKDAAGSVLGHIAAPLAETVSTGLPLGPLSLVSAVGRNVQLYRLSEDVQKVLTVSMAGTVLAGLGLAVSIGGFIYLSRRMTALERRLSQLESDTKTIRDILLTEYRAKLSGAMDDYRNATKTEDSGLQKQVLLRAQRTFGDLAYIYRDLMRDLPKLVDKTAAEQYFVLSSIGHTMCLSDLGFWDDAHTSLETHYAHWASLAKQQTAGLLELNEPAKLLHRQYVDALPSETLIAILDFAGPERRGLGWIDEIRRGLADTTLVLAIGRIDDHAIEVAKSLVARDKGLNSYVDHFHFLAQRKVSVTRFANAVDGYLQQGVAAGQ